MSTIPELLAPAGDLMKLKYAFAYGADAVYAGVPRFSLRVKENNFDRETIQNAVEISHQLNKKIYLTLNIYPHNRKIEQFKETLLWMESLKPDAIIISDPGIILMSQKYCPSIPLHLSTQANTVNWMSAKFWHQQGLKRIILSRELSINEISEIRQRVPEIELETFVHGAICVSYSGRCLLSNYFTHRDSNQGTCTNSCRWDYKIYSEGDFSTNEPYRGIDGNYFLEEKERPGQLLPIDEDENGTYIMNSRDLCAIRILDRLRDAGIDSFKIEGRNKSVYYVTVITRAYRQAMDDLKDAKPFDNKLEMEMFTVANRGYITGFLEKNPHHLGENFRFSHSANQTHQFSAVVRQMDRKKGIALISVRNRISLGDQVEAIFPSGSVSFVINEIFTVDGKSVQDAHGGGDDIFINVPEQIDENTLIRKAIQPYLPSSNDNIIKITVGKT
jgi:putative protease